MRLLGSLTLCLLSCGCASKKPVHGLNYLIPLTAITQVELLDCDTQSPPKCKHAKIVFNKGSEQMEVNQ